MSTLHGALIEAMKELEVYQDDPLVGIFWYDRVKKELFGVYNSFADSNEFYHSNLFNLDVKTDRRLHKNVWKKESFRQKDKRFTGNHTLIPRGRVFQFGDNSFKICVGKWIDENPEAIEKIIDEFDLPKENTSIIKDEHWDIGHGFSEEDF